MNPRPAHIPRSLKTYLELYREEPAKAIERLEEHLTKRGADAVGFYLLAWLYHFENQRKEAVRSAWRAKIYAPGSPAMEQLHYYMKHPENFNAWKPSKPVIKSYNKKSDEGNRNLPISDLDALIHKLSSMESKKITADPSGDPDDGPDLSKESSKVDDIVTETLAKIHEKQGSKKNAIETYQRLMNIHTHKKSYYKEQIERLNAEIEKDELEKGKNDDEE